jgi:hypothetical protein
LGKISPIAKTTIGYSQRLQDNQVRAAQSALKEVNIKYSKKRKSLHEKTQSIHQRANVK